MSKYFDKDFFRFLMGFITIITLSLIIILATQIYNQNLDGNTANVIDASLGAE